jgi:protein translocase SecG subunit
MTILNIVQMIVAFLVILLVTLQVKKDASGLAGLMGSSTNNKNVPSKLDKPTKYMLALVLAYIFISFGVSYQQSVAAQSVVTEKRIESSKSKE